MGEFAVLGVTALVGQGDGDGLVLGTPGFFGPADVLRDGLFGCGFNEGHGNGEEVAGVQRPELLAYAVLPHLYFPLLPKV
jgi:hypothetical protein